MSLVAAYIIYGFFVAFKIVIQLIWIPISLPWWFCTEHEYSWTAECYCLDFSYGIWRGFRYGLIGFIALLFLYVIYDHDNGALYSFLTFSAVTLLIYSVFKVFINVSMADFKGFDVINGDTIVKSLLGAVGVQTSTMPERRRRRLTEGVSFGEAVEEYKRNLRPKNNY
eukprot:UN24964